MNILLDTCTFLWIIWGKEEKFSEKAKNVFLDEKNTLYLSVVSFWEILVKYKKGQIEIEGDPKKFLIKQCEENDIVICNLQQDAIFEMVNLPDIHKDPFDRMIVCQAKSYNWSILSADTYISSYPVEVIW